MQLQVFGLVSRDAFHRTGRVAQDLFFQLPGLFSKPNITAMLEMDWITHVQSQQKELGGDLWAFTGDSICFLDGRFLGSDLDLLRWAGRHFDYEQSHEHLTTEADKGKAYTTHLEKTKNMYVSMDIDIGGDPAGKIVFELFTDICPKTCDNFISLCVGQTAGLHYAGSSIHRVVPDGWLQGGDIVSGKGNRGQSVFGGDFEDENFIVRHHSRGMLGMVNHGRNTNNSQFYITFRPAHWLDRKYVAFGRVVEGVQTMDRLQVVQLRNERPVRECTIASCGKHMESPLLNFRN
uniref:probable inactive peptidyl-prolyl cis-trans isomerase-like 6 n=1 Tax=Myxine glutinosa TaxID=7769 RepID=UPI00358F2028